MSVCARRFKGVKVNKRTGRWEAQIKANGKLMYLGLFEEEGEAAEAYDQAVILVRVRAALTRQLRV
jgi:hypothetical protein